MNPTSSSWAYLVVTSRTEDEQKLDQAIQRGDLNIRRLGLGTYLAFLQDNPKQTYPLWKERHGITGEIQWIELPRPIVTR
jgi:hypothetical protein